MKIVIAGAGAMGCRFGSSLFKQGYDVTLIDCWEEHIDSIQQKGLLVKNENGSEQIAISISSPEKFQLKADLVILFTKTNQTNDMLTRCKHIIDKQTTLLTLQNGFGNIEIISRHIPKEQILLGVTTIAAKLTAPGEVEAFGSGRTELMDLKPHPHSNTEDIIDILNASGIQTELSIDIIKSVWNKAAFNSVLNPLCTLTLLPVSDVLQYKHIIKIINGILDEIILVASKENINLNKLEILQTIMSVADPALSGNHYSSMYQDIANGKITEIDYLNGHIVKLAAKHEIPVYFNSLIYHLIKMKEKQAQRVKI